MSGIFLSHSSQDKELATKLACDLTLGGFDVWFDSWEVEIGDSLYDRVFRGIDDATFLLLCLSPNAVKSEWVLRELDAALAKEKEIGPPGDPSSFCSPSASCRRPSRGRMLADVSCEYLKGLEDLKGALRRRGADGARSEFDHRLVPLRLVHGLHLERVELQRYFEGRLAPEIRNGAALDWRQVLAIPDNRVERMVSVFRTTVDQIDSHPGYTPDLENYFRQRYVQLEKLNEGLRKGVADIANGLVVMGDCAFFSEACFWFLQIVRHKMLHILAETWKFAGVESPPPLGEEAIADPLGNDDYAARLYGVTEVISCDVFKESGEYIKVLVGSDCEVWDRVNRFPMVPESLGSLAPGPSFYHKYLVPQMVARHRLWSARPSAWDLPGSWMMGLA